MIRDRTKVGKIIKTKERLWHLQYLQTMGTGEHFTCTLGNLCCIPNITPGDELDLLRITSGEDQGAMGGGQAVEVCGTPLLREETTFQSFPGAQHNGLICCEVWILWALDFIGALRLCSIAQV